jgi:Kef-type K+ transport system membrane component KefB
MASSVLPLLFVLVVIVAAAKAAGLLSTYLRQPAVLGELLAGLLLGPSLLDLLSWAPLQSAPHLAEVIAEFAELGVILLMFIAGLEVDLGQMRKSGRVVLLAGTLGVVVPLFLGMLTALPFGYLPVQALAIGMLLTATSVSISAQTLLELGALRSKEGIALLGAAVVDDVLVIILLSAFLAVTGGNGAGLLGILWLIARMVIFMALFGLFGWLVLPWFFDRVARLPISQGLVAASVVVTLAYAWSAEVVGHIAMITGAFMAGIFAARSAVHRSIYEGVSALTYGFFVPIFFINIGLQADVRGLSGSTLVLSLLIVAVAILSKVVGCGLGALIGGFNAGEALRLGMGMISRGEVGLIVATMIVASGIVPKEIITLAVLMVLSTTLVTPPLLRIVFARQREPEEAVAGAPVESVEAQ